MAISIDPATLVITVNQADLTFISGALYELDTDQFRKDVNDILAAENGIWMADAYTHNSEVTVAGTTFARTIEIINSYSITFEDLVYSVRLAGSNNNIFDVENSILNPSGNVTVIAQNSAGLISSPDITVIRKLVQNRNQVNPSTNKMEVYNDAGSAIEHEGDIFKDTGGATPWDGTGDIIRRDKLDSV